MKGKLQEEIGELMRIALTWPKGNRAQAEKMVDAYLRGCLDAEQIKVRSDR